MIVFCSVIKRRTYFNNTLGKLEFNVINIEMLQFFTLVFPQYYSAQIVSTKVTEKEAEICLRKTQQKVSLKCKE